MDTDLDYNYIPNSSVLGEDKNADPDTGNIPLYKNILKELKQLKGQYHTTDKLSLDDKHFTVEQQLANNQWAVTLIGMVELMINEKVKEFTRGR